MADGGLLVLRPQSRLSVDTWKFDPNAPALSEIKYTLTEGVTRYVSGKGAQAAKESFRLNTPLAAIGVRGTDFTALAGADITLVSVRSGGVVVGAFGTGCTPESAGPCSGDKTAELFATRDSDKLLQVRRGDVVPRLIDATLTNSPEKVRPAAPGEPVATGIDPFKSAEIPKPGALASLAALPNSASDEAIDFAAWGRWGTLTASEGAEVVKSLVQGRNLVAINRYYAIATNPTSSLELPSAGVGQFRLVSHDGLLIDPSTGAVSTTNVTDGALRVDFGARRFNTNLNLTTSRIATSVQSSGYIEPSGRLSSDAYVSATVVEGALGGGPASQAIYTYRRLASGQVPEVSGVLLASWGGHTRHSSHQQKLTLSKTLKLDHAASSTANRPTIAARHAARWAHFCGAGHSRQPAMDPLCPTASQSLRERCQRPANPLECQPLPRNPARCGGHQRREPSGGWFMAMAPCHHCRPL